MKSYLIKIKTYSLRKKKLIVPSGSKVIKLLHLNFRWRPEQCLLVLGGAIGIEGKGCGLGRRRSMPHRWYSAISSGVSGPTFGRGKSLQYTGLSTI